MGWMVEATPYTIPEGEKYMETFIKIYTKTYWWSHRYCECETYFDNWKRVGADPKYDRRTSYVRW